MCKTKLKHLLCFEDVTQPTSCRTVFSVELQTPFLFVSNPSSKRLHESSTNNIIKYINANNEDDRNSTEFLQLLNLPVLNTDNKMEDDHTEIIIASVPDDVSQSEKTDEVEYLLNNPTTSNILDGHVIILHEGKQFLIRPDQINENGEVFLNAENAINGLIFNDNDNTVNEVESLVFEQSDSNSSQICYQNEEKNDNSIEYNEEYLEDEEIVEHFGDENASENDVNAKDDQYNIDESCMVIVKDDGDNSNIESDFSTEHFLEQIQCSEPGRKKFAIIKDGKIHIREGVIDDDSDIVENHVTNFDNTFQSEIDDNISEDDSGNTVSQNFGIAGRNLVTGQTISLDTFLSNISARNKSWLGNDLTARIKQEPGVQANSKTDKSMFPMRLTVGHTASGKKIVGKILQIKRPGEDPDTSEPPVLPKKRFKPTAINEFHDVKKSNLGRLSNNIAEIILDSTGNILHQVNGNIIVSRNEMDGLTKKTLCGLMDLETVQKNLIGRNIIVRNIHKKINRKTNSVGHKSIKYFKGSFKKEENSLPMWNFVENYIDVSEKQNTQLDDDNSIQFEQNIDLNTTDDDRQQIEVSNSEQILQDILEDPAKSRDVSNSIETYTEDKPPTQKVTIKSIEKINDILPKSLMITITVIEDESGKKRTKVIIPEMSKVDTHCVSCNKFFRTAQHLRRHMKAMHCPGDKLYHCDLCLKSFIDTSTLTRHRRIHSGDKNHQCNLCLKAFNTAGSLKRHITVHNPNLRPLQCLTCLQRFTDESSLKKHMLLHTGIKPFECDICYKRFVYHGDLNFHRKIHDPSKRFICDTCGKEFSRQSNLIRHVNIHKDNGNTFKCDICGITYNFMSSLTRHIVNNHMKDS